MLELRTQTYIRETFSWILASACTLNLDLVFLVQDTEYAVELLRILQDCGLGEFYHTLLTAHWVSITTVIW